MLEYKRTFEQEGCLTSCLCVCVCVCMCVCDPISLTRDRTWAPAMIVPSPNHWTTREFPTACLKCGQNHLHLHPLLSFAQPARALPHHPGEDRKFGLWRGKLGVQWTQDPRPLGTEELRAEYGKGLRENPHTELGDSL